MRLTHRAAVAGPAASALLALAAQTVDAHGNQAPEPTISGVLTAWSGEVLPLVVALLAGLAYVAAAVKVNSTAPRLPIPRWRVGAFLAGCGVILVALESAVDVYADNLLSIHMVQHLLLAMVAPALFAVSAPVTLALRVASPAIRRRLLLPVLHARLVRLLASPIVAWATFTVVMFATHFSPLYDAALEDPRLHLLEHGLFLVSGCLFWWPVAASDPIPGRLGYGGRLAYVALQMPVNAAVGLAIYFAPSVLYSHYATLTRTWGPSALTDQQLGGALMWGAGDVLLLGAVPLVVAAWMRAEERRTRAMDARRAAARSDVVPAPVTGR
jgi:cytochrome c oxidase assembly factor CtaG